MPDFMQQPPEGPPVPLPRQLAVTGLGAAWAARRRLAPRAAPPGLLLYGQGRTGSTLLGTLLGSHPRVVMRDEVLRGPCHLPALYLEGLRARTPRRVVCVHVKPYHLTSSQGVADRGAWLARVSRAGWAVVHLQRHDVLRHALSNVVMSASGRTHRTGDDGSPRPLVTVDVAELLQIMAARQRYADEELRDVAGIPHETVVYERDLLPGGPAWQATCDRLFRAVGLPSAPVGSHLRRTGSDRLAELVANPDEVVAAVRSSRWAHLVEAS